MLVDETLSWGHHIAHIASKRHFVPLSTLNHIYRSLIQPYLLYGTVAWGQAAKIHRDKILILQKRALRLMYFGDYRSHAIPFSFFSFFSRFLPLDMLYFKSVAISWCMTYQITCHLLIYLTYLLTKLIFISIRQDHLQEATFWRKFKIRYTKKFIFKKWCKNLEKLILWSAPAIKKQF